VPCARAPAVGLAPPWRSAPRPRRRRDRRLRRDRQSPIEFEGIRARYLPEAVAHTKAQHHKSRYALRAAAMRHGGVDLGRFDDVQWWRDDDLWYWSLEALAAYIRAAADRIVEPDQSVCRQIADERGITFTGVAP
jgi:hypothetical protein